MFYICFYIDSRDPLSLPLCAHMISYLFMTHNSLPPGQHFNKQTFRWILGNWQLIFRCFYTILLDTIHNQQNSSYIPQKTTEILKYILKQSCSPINKTGSDKWEENKIKKPEARFEETLILVN